MKTNCTLFALITLSVLVFSPFTSVKATNYTDAGTANLYNLFAGDTLKIVSGTYKGTISLFNSKAVIVIGNNSSFRPLAFSSPKGVIINYGSIKLMFPLGTLEGFQIQNFGTMSVTGDFKLYDSWSTSQTIQNFIGGKIDITGSLNIGNNGKVFNDGMLNIGGDCELYSNGSQIANTGYMNITGDLSQSAGKVMNYNDMKMRSYNGSGGTLENQGGLRPSEDLYISSGSTYVNMCKLVTGRALYVYGTYDNQGITWVGKNNQAVNELYITGTFLNGGYGQVKTATLKNYNTIKGSGYIYVYGASTNSGYIGTSGYTTDTLALFDATRTGSNYFDNNWNTIYPNCVFRNQGIPDTTQMPPGCTYMYRTGFVLPIKWNYFSAKLQQGQPLLSWSADYEANMKFELERSFDQVNFNKINEQVSNNTASYSYTDQTVPAAQTVAYYRIKATSADGEVKFSETRMVKLSGSAKSSVISLFPNPAANATSLTYTTDKTETITVLVKSASGQQLSMRNFTARAGANKFELEMIRNFQPGVYFVEVISGSQSLGTERLVKR
jgi:hypothetical protein